jgi:hypothetical protein
LVISFAYRLNTLLNFLNDSRAGGIQHYCAELLGGMAGLVDGVHLMPVVLEKRCVIFVQRVRAALGLPALERPTIADAFAGC